MVFQTKILYKVYKTHTHTDSQIYSHKYKTPIYIHTYINTNLTDKYFFTLQKKEKKIGINIDSINVFVSMRMSVCVF